MALDYIQTFSIVGSYLDKINDYFMYYATLDDDKGDIDFLFAGENLVRLGDGLTEDYNDFKSEVSGWISTLISRISAVLTDEELIGQNFSFGQTATLDLVWPALIHDMNENSESVDESTSTVGVIEYDTQNTEIGVLVTGTTLDGVTPPMAGAPIIREYAGLTTQLTPDDEILTLTCTSDSETGATRGSETFQITGTLAGSDPFSPGGENVGQLGSIQAADNAGNQYLSNGGFDSWTDGLPDNWSGGTAGECFEESTTVVYGSGSSLKTLQEDDTLALLQTLSGSLLVRKKAYFLSVWAAKDTDVATDQSLSLLIGDDGGAFASLNFAPTTTNWENFTTQFLVPDEIEGDIKLYLQSTTDLSSSNDPVIVDNIVIVPCDYFSGVALAVFSGPDKFLIGDQIRVPLSNDSDGKFQAFFRKAYKVQLPTSGSATIPETLIV